MKVSDNLFQLIKSMSKPEKGYFKKYASMHTIGEQNNYVMLFDLIEKQASKQIKYDEDKIKRRLNDKLVSQFAVMKNYLYATVLESLHLFHSQNRKDTQVNAMIDQIDLLMRRLIYDQAHQLLRKAKRIAEEYEFFTELIRLLSLEKRLLAEIMEPDDFTIHFKRICEEENQAISKLENTIEFSNLRARLIEFTSRYGTGFSRDDSKKEFFESLLKEPILSSEEYALTRNNKRHYNHLKSNIYSYINDPENTEKYQLRYIKYHEEDIKKVTSYQPLIAGLNNLLTMQIRYKSYEGAEETLIKLRDFEKNYSVTLNEYESSFIFYAYSVLGISYCMARVDIARGLQIIKESRPLEKMYSNKLGRGRQLIVYYFHASLLFMAERFDETSAWITKILQMPATDFSSDYQCYARLMNLIVQYELKNYNHLDYVMKSTYYFLRKRKKIFKYEEIIIKYMKRSLRMRSEAELTELFDEMKYELEAIYKDDHEKFGFDAFNIIPWLESKITKKPMSEILKSMK